MNHQFIINSFRIYIIFISLSVLFSFVEPHTDTSDTDVIDDFTIELIPTAESCPTQGSITITPIDTTAGAILTYNIYKAPDYTNPIRTTSEKQVGGLVAGEYRVIATQNLGRESNQTQRDIEIFDALNPVSFTVSVIDEICGNDGSIQVNVSSGRVDSFALTEGPVTRTFQDSSLFEDLPDGDYKVAVKDQCGNISTIDVPVNSENLGIEISRRESNFYQLPSCDSMYIAQVLNSNNSDFIAYPLSIKYTVHPPSGPDICIEQFVPEKYGTSTDFIRDTLPFYYNQAFSYDIQITDDCGNVNNRNNNVVDEDLHVRVTEWGTSGCLDDRYLELTPAVGKAPFTIEFDSYPAGFDPITFNPNYLNPFDVSVTFGDFDNPLPYGNYSYRIKDACENEKSFNYTRQAFRNTLTHEVGIECNKLGGVLLFHNELIQLYIITAAPNTYTKSIPDTIINDPISSSSKRIILPEGDYTINAVNETCGFDESIDITLFEYVEPIGDYDIELNCGSFNITQRFEFAEGNYGFIKIQNFNTTSGRWTNLNGDPYFPRAPNLTNGVPFNVTAGSGRYRIFHYWTGARNGDELCMEVLAEFEVDLSVSADNIFGFDCGDGIVDVAIEATGAEPVIYEITHRNGTPFSVNNGTDPIFNDLTAGLYTFRIVDDCGNTFIREYDVTTLIGPEIIASDICDGGVTSLFTADIPTFNYSWWKSTDPTTELSDSAQLVFDNLDITTDTGLYFLRINYTIEESCIDDTLTYRLMDNGIDDIQCQNLTVYLDNAGSVTITADQINNGSSDDCGIQDVSLSQSTFDCTDLGDNSIFLRLTNNNGVTDSCMATVTVRDTIKPVCIAHDTILYLNNNGLASLSAQSIDDGSSDNCTISVFDLSMTSFDCQHIGDTVIYLKVTDSSGNVDSCTTMVTVRDTIKPVCNVIPTLSTTWNDLGLLRPVDINDGSDDNCDIVTMRVNAPAATCDDIGKTIDIFLVVEDGSGNTDSCMVELTIIDKVAPTCNLKSIDIYLGANGIASFDGNSLDNDSTDDCGTFNIIPNPQVVTCDDIGSKTINVSVIDGSGNSTSCSVDVMVIDTFCSPCTYTPTCRGSEIWGGYGVVTCAGGAFSNEAVAALIDLNNYAIAPLGDNWADPVSAGVDPVPMMKPSTWTIDELGQIFGMTINNQTGDIFFGATNLYAYDGDPFTPTGIGPGGESGIYKANFSTPEIIQTLVTTSNTFISDPVGSSVVPGKFLDLTLINNPLPTGWGNIAVDPTSNTLYGSNLSDGRIYAIDGSSGIIKQVLDPFPTGGSGFLSDPFPSNQVIWALELNECTQQLFFIQQTVSGGGDALGDDGGVRNKNLYTIDINDNGLMSNLTLIQGLNAGTREKLTDIDFNSTCDQMLLAERGTVHNSLTLLYGLNTIGTTWGFLTDISAGNIAGGDPWKEGLNSAGGVAFGPDNVLWTMADCLDPSLVIDECNVYGPQGVFLPESNFSSLSGDLNNSAIFIDITPEFTHDPRFQKFGIGDIEIFGQNCPDRACHFYDLAIDKSVLGDGTYELGDKITYSITVTNEGGIDATNIQVTDFPDAGLVYVNSNVNSIANVTQNGLNFTIPELDAGESQSFSLTFSIDTEYTGNQIMNIVEITGDDGDDIDSDPDIRKDTDDGLDGTNPGDDDGGNIGQIDDDDEYMVMVAVESCPTPMIIDGPETVCPNSLIAYSVDIVEPNNNLTWSYDGDATIVYLDNSNDILLNFGGSQDGGILRLYKRSELIISKEISISESDLCDLINCANVCPFLDDEILNLQDAPDIFSSPHAIQSNGTIRSGRSVIFKAARSIDLFPGFNVQENAEFEAIIEDCEDDNLMLNLFCQGELIIESTDCLAIQFESAIEASSTCSNSYTFSAQIDLYNDGTFDISQSDLESSITSNNNTASLSSTIVPGTHRIQWFTSDGCDNQVSCENKLNVQQLSAPSAKAKDISTSLMSNGEVNIQVSDLDDGSPNMCNGLTVNNAIVRSGGLFENATNSITLTCIDYINGPEIDIDFYVYIVLSSGDILREFVTVKVNINDATDACFE